MSRNISCITAAILACSLSAQAAVTITIKEVGADVVVTGSGSINNINGASYLNDSTIGAGILYPTFGLLINGGAPDTIASGYTLTDAPVAFGSGPPAEPTLKEGTIFGVTLDPGNGYPGTFFLDPSYTLGSPIQFSQQYASHNFESLELNAGQYIWRWGTPDNGDFISICIGDAPPCVQPSPAAATPVPALGAFGLIGLATAISAAGVAITRRRKHR